MISSTEEIKEAILSLPEPEYIRLRDWIVERDWVKWDQKIEQNSQEGRLDFLVKEAFSEKKQDILKKL